MSWEDTPCIEWEGSRYPNGYGQHQRGGLVHRRVWAETHGPIPEGMCVCHHCDNPPCYNIEHLFLGTYADNTHDAMMKGRFVRCDPTGTTRTAEYKAKMREVRLQQTMRQTPEERSEITKKGWETRRARANLRI